MHWAWKNYWFWGQWLLAMLIWGFMFMQANLEGHISELGWSRSKTQAAKCRIPSVTHLKLDVWMQGCVSACSEEIQKIGQEKMLRDDNFTYFPHLVMSRWDHLWNLQNRKVLGFMFGFRLADTPLQADIHMFSWKGCPHESILEHCCVVEIN